MSKKEFRGTIWSIWLNKLVVNFIRETPSKYFGD